MRRWLAAAGAVLLLTSCTGSSSNVSVPRPRLHGTELMDGLVVAPGSRLLGAVFTTPTRSIRDRGISNRAIVVIDRDPVKVYDEYVNQARRLGFLIGGSGASDQGFGTCRSQSFYSTVTTPMDATDGTRPRRLTCTGRGQRTGSEPGLFTAAVTWGESMRYAVLSVGTPEPIVYRDLGDARAATPSPLPKVADARLATKPGTRFGTRNNGFNSGYRRFTLEPGSRVVAELDDASLLYIDGDARDVMNGYAEQLGQGGMRPKVTEEATGRGDVLTVSNGPIGGGDAVLLTDPSNRWLLIETSSD